MWYKLFAGFMVFGFSLNHILLMIGLFTLLGINFYGAWLAFNQQSFGVSDIKHITKTNNMVAVKNSNFSEKWAFVSVLSLIPFIGFTVKGQYASHKSIFLENNLKINLFCTFLICFLFMTHPNLAQLILLAYFIFIAFFGLLMIVQKQILDFSLAKIPTMQTIYIYFLAVLSYVGNYFTKKDFIPYTQVIENTKHTFVTKQTQRKSFVVSLRDPSLPVQISYIPYINLVGLIDYNSQNRFHIINGICITILSSLLWITGYNQLQVFVLFLVFFGWGYLKHKEYVFPFLYDVYTIFTKIWGKIFSKTKEVAENGQQVQEVRFQVYSNTNAPPAGIDHTPPTPSPVAAIPTARTQTGTPIPKMEIPAMDITQNPTPNTNIPPKNVFDQIGRPQPTPSNPTTPPPTQNTNIPPQ